ncbi:MAG: methylmalonyl Co-A mutase-associated GTPase MeaB [Candidatus Krumholzibacteriota bacterium]|nr:methylmalonyl Co-A mutase-associated GTPase MeaB [Candidatus Krumholzibacteriota bacterium]
MKDELLERFFNGETLAASKVMSLVEAGGEDAENILASLYTHTGRANRVALTGGTGSGKSTLAGALSRHYRAANKTVGVIAEDPTSPFTGGAILGDRIRIHRTSGDEGVFVRSIASRGSQTGFSTTAAELVDVLDAFGRDVILLETIGIGQLEHRIRHAADTTVVVMTPESGDEVQALKSGLMEVGDVFVVNKSDRPHADAFLRDVATTLELRGEGTDWQPPVVATVATGEEGIEDLVRAIAAHRSFLEDGERLQRRRHEGMRQRIRALAEEKLSGAFWGNRYIDGHFDGIFDDVISGQLSPHGAAAKLVKVFVECGKKPQ